MKSVGENPAADVENLQEAVQKIGNKYSCVLFPIILQLGVINPCPRLDVPMPTVSVTPCGGPGDTGQFMPNL